MIDLVSHLTQSLKHRYMFDQAWLDILDISITYSQNIEELKRYV